MQWTFNVKGVYPDATPGSRASGPASSLSLSSTASRARLGITNGGTSEQRAAKEFTLWGDQRLAKHRCYVLQAAHDLQYRSHHVELGV
ncbi:hypothetical protein GQ600_12343 [Phytophthora cactorum]|nr:hypothetical protein GQ600_12343 [Phytophthora cactorum]